MVMFIIQLIPQHLAEGDDSKERTVQVTGDKRQVEIAREMINEVMNQVSFRFYVDYVEEVSSFPVLAIDSYFRCFAYVSIGRIDY